MHVFQYKECCLSAVRNTYSIQVRWEYNDYEKKLLFQLSEMRKKNVFGKNIQETKYDGCLGHLLGNSKNYPEIF